MASHKSGPRHSPTSEINDFTMIDSEAFEERNDDNTYFRNLVIGSLLTLCIIGLGCIGFYAFNMHQNQLTERARTSCIDQSNELSEARTTYLDLVENDAAQASTISDIQVANTATVHELAQVMQTEEPTVIECNANTAQELESRTQKIAEQITWYEQQQQHLQQAIQKVTSSKEEADLTQARETLSNEMRDSTNTLDSVGTNVTDEQLLSTLRTMLSDADAMMEEHNIDAINDMTQQLRESKDSVVQSHENKVIEDEERAKREQEERAKRDAESKKDSKNNNKNDTTNNNQSHRN